MLINQKQGQLDRERDKLDQQAPNGVPSPEHRLLRDPSHPPTPHTAPIRHPPSRTLREATFQFWVKRRGPIGFRGLIHCSSATASSVPGIPLAVDSYIFTAGFGVLYGTTSWKGSRLWLWRPLLMP